MVTENLSYNFDDLPAVLSVSKIVELLGTSRNGVAEQIRNGNLKAFSILSENRPKYRVLREDFIAWLTRNPVKPIRGGAK
jgi:Helix-turn-helix domain